MTMLIIIGAALILSGIFPLVMMIDYIRHFEKDLDTRGFAVLLGGVSIALIAFGILVIVCGI